MTETMKLELKHIQHYPIGGENALTITNGSEVKKVDGIYTFDNKTEFWFKSGGWNLHCDSWKPILRPMSDLYKPLKDRTYPIAVIGRIYEPKGKLYCEDGVYTYGWNTHVCDDYQGYEIGWIESAGWFGLFYDTYDYENQDENFTGDYLTYNREIAEYLDKNHFDWRYNLLDQNIAINLNDIE